MRAMKDEWAIFSSKDFALQLEKHERGKILNFRIFFFEKIDLNSCHCGVLELPQPYPKLFSQKT